MDAPDLGPQVSYLALSRGAQVYGPDGSRMGKVRRVLAWEKKDIFKGIVVAAEDRDRYVEAADVAAVHEGGVLLRLTPEQFAALPDPDRRGPAQVAAELEASLGDLRAQARLRWQRLTGRRH